MKLMHKQVDRFDKISSPLHMLKNSSLKKQKINIYQFHNQHLFMQEYPILSQNIF